jgi:hypothetical protein
MSTFVIFEAVLRKMMLNKLRSSFQSCWTFLALELMSICSMILKSSYAIKD